jgi:chromate reductase
LAEAASSSATGASQNRLPVNVDGVVMLTPQGMMEAACRQVATGSAETLQARRHSAPRAAFIPFASAQRSLALLCALAHSLGGHALACWVQPQGGHLKMNEIGILGIVGSLRKDSYNHFALKAAQELVPEGAVLNLIELRGIPIYDQDNEMAPPEIVLEFKRRILAADAILFATPEYNYSIPGGLKNAIDWASRPYGESAWLGKPTAIMGASVGNLGTARAQYHLRQILVAQNMPVVNQPEVMIASATKYFDQSGRLTDETTRQFIQKLLAELVRLVTTIRRATAAPANA